MQRQTRRSTAYGLFGMMAILGWQGASALEVSWQKQPGIGTYLSGNAAGELWVVGAERVDPKGYHVYSWNGKGLDTRPLGVAARRVAVTPASEVWSLDDWNDLMYYTSGSFPRFTKAHDVAVGANNVAWILGTDRRAGGYGVYYLSGTT